MQGISIPPLGTHLPPGTALCFPVMFAIIEYIFQEVISGYKTSAKASGIMATPFFFFPFTLFRHCVFVCNLSVICLFSHFSVHDLFSLIFPLALCDVNILICFTGYKYKKLSHSNDNWKLTSSWKC